jgi:hypothetical protein
MLEVGREQGGDADRETLREVEFRKLSKIGP